MPTILSLARVSRGSKASRRCRRRRSTASTCASVLKPRRSPLRAREQYYECWSNARTFANGWLARSLQGRGQPIDCDNWTLHDLDEDFSEVPRSRTKAQTSSPSSSRASTAAAAQRRVSARQPHAVRASWRRAGLVVELANRAALCPRHKTAHRPM
jgi:hypothetical protein